MALGLIYCCCSTQRAQPPDPQARGPLSLWTAHLGADVQHNATPDSQLAADLMSAALFNTMRNPAARPHARPLSNALSSH